MNDAATLVPDLLRRFAPTPHVCMLCIGGLSVRLETNDPILARAIQSVTLRYEPRDSDSASHWKLIRDEQAPCGGIEVTILSAGPIGLLLLGSGTVIAADRERREILGFVAADLSAEKCAAVVLPLIFDLLRASGKALFQ